MTEKNGSDIWSLRETKLKARAAIDKEPGRSGDLSVVGQMPARETCYTVQDSLAGNVEGKRQSRRSNVCEHRRRDRTRSEQPPPHAPQRRPQACRKGNVR